MLYAPHAELAAVSSVKRGLGQIRGRNLFHEYLEGICLFHNTFTRYGLRYSTEIYGGETAFHEYLEEACSVLAGIS